MKKLVLVLAVLLVQTGCVHSRTLCLQVCVAVRMVNNCAHVLDVEDINGPLGRLAYSQSETFVLVSTAFSGNNRFMPLVVKGWAKDGKYLGSETRQFYVDTSEGSRREVWEVDNLNLPRNGGCEGESL